MILLKMLLPGKSRPFIPVTALLVLNSVLKKASTNCVPSSVFEICFIVLINDDWLLLPSTKDSGMEDLLLWIDLDIVRFSSGKRWETVKTVRTVKTVKSECGQLRVKFYHGIFDRLSKLSDHGGKSNSNKMSKQCVTQGCTKFGESFQNTDVTCHDCKNRKYYLFL